MTEPTASRGYGRIGVRFDLVGPGAEKLAAARTLRTERRCEIEGEDERALGRIAERPMAMPSNVAGRMGWRANEHETRTQDSRRCEIFVRVRLRPRVAGAGLLVLPREEPTELSKATHPRQQLALGRHGQARPEGVRVGVVGLGGTGSVVCTLLGRLGIRWFLLIDGDHFEASNLSRVLESARADIDAKTPKVTIAGGRCRPSLPTRRLSLSSDPSCTTATSICSQRATSSFRASTASHRGPF